MNIRKLAVWILLLTSGCKERIPKVDDNNVYDLINAFYGRTNKNPPYSTSKFLLSREIFPNQLPEYNDIRPEVRDTLPFTKEDWDFMHSQMVSSLNQHFDQSEIKTLKVVEYDKVRPYIDSHGLVDWPATTKNLGITNFSTISIPYFSKNQNLALFQVIEYSANESDQGGQVLIFEKVNGKWECKDQLSYWESDNSFP